MIVLLPDGTALLVLSDGRAIEEPLGRLQRELGCTQKALSHLLGWPQGDVSNAQSGRRPLGPGRMRRLGAFAASVGVDLTAPQYVLRCGLWLRNGALDPEQRAALRAEVDRRRRQMTWGSTGGYHHGELRRRQPSQRVGPSGGYIPLTYRSFLSPHARAGLERFEGAAE